MSILQETELTPQHGYHCPVDYEIYVLYRRRIFPHSYHHSCWYIIYQIADRHESCIYTTNQNTNEIAVEACRIPKDGKVSIPNRWWAYFCITTIWWFLLTFQEPSVVRNTDTLAYYVPRPLNSKKSLDWQWLALMLKYKFLLEKMVPQTTVED